LQTDRDQTTSEFSHLACPTYPRYTAILLSGVHAPNCTQGLNTAILSTYHNHTDSLTSV